MELANHFRLESCPKYREESEHPKIPELQCRGQPDPSQIQPTARSKLRRVFTSLSSRNQKNSVFFFDT